jgi:hypothetical protein
MVMRDAKPDLWAGTVKTWLLLLVGGGLYSAGAAAGGNSDPLAALAPGVVWQAGFGDGSADVFAAGGSGPALRAGLCFWRRAVLSALSPTGLPPLCAPVAALRAPPSSVSHVGSPPGQCILLSFRRVHHVRSLCWLSPLLGKEHPVAARLHPIISAQALLEFTGVCTSQSVLRGHCLVLLSLLGRLQAWVRRQLAVAGLSVELRPNLPWASGDPFWRATSACHWAAGWVLMGFSVVVRAVVVRVAFWRAMASLWRVGCDWWDVGGAAGRLWAGLDGLSLWVHGDALASAQHFSSHVESIHIPPTFTLCCGKRLIFLPTAHTL